MRRKGFTLLELLTVMAIIAVITGILLPAFAYVRGVARRTDCLSNERQLGKAILMYAADHDDRLPSQVGDLRTHFGNGWALKIYPYIKNVQVYRCLDDDTDCNPSRVMCVFKVVSFAYNASLINTPYATFLFSLRNEWG